MNTSEIKTYFSGLSVNDKNSLLEELIILRDDSEYNLMSIREDQLNNKSGKCPHCNGLKYTKNGIEKSGVQRYICKKCNRSFNSYTGTWLAKINHKELLIPYIKLMQQGLSLDKIKNILKINKKTAFDWRHKISASVGSIEENEFKGITESDETFFLSSEKGSQSISRKSRKRGGKASKRGISNEQVASIITMDRNRNIDMKVAGFGRIKKSDIEKAIGSKINEQTILCSDGHMSYKGFALDKELEHHVLRANLKQYIKGKKYHLQHVNSADSRLKTWINGKMHGVATKYLQNYLYWFRVNEKFKEVDIIQKVISSALDIKGLFKWNNIELTYIDLLYKSQAV